MVIDEKGRVKEEQSSSEVGDRVITMVEGVEIITPWSKEVDIKPSKSLSNIIVLGSNVKKVGNIWWIEINTSFQITANVGLPNSQMMVIIEQVVRNNNGEYITVNDKRVIANIADGVVTIKGSFERDGNYRITQERLNMGLDEIGAPFNLSFDLIEFDAYEQTA